MSTNLIPGYWRKSSRSNGAQGACVEVNLYRSPKDQDTEGHAIATPTVSRSVREGTPNRSPVAQSDL